ncbi:MAG: response regulator [Cyanobacteriota bacterium]|nr:response regulator [Cyanobacteriota bacterium]
MAKFNQLFRPKIKKQLPLRLVLTLPVVLQICAFISILGWLSLVNSQTAVNEIVNQLQKEISSRVEERTKTYTRIPYLFMKIHSSAVKTGELDLEDFPKFQRYLWEQVQLYESVPFIYYANEQGEFIGVEKKEDGTGILWILDKPKIPRLTFYQLDKEGKRGDFIESKKYDPRTRPWYQSVIKNVSKKQSGRIGKPIWSPTYADIRRPILVSSLMVPIYTETENFQGILATDLSLVSLSGFLRDLDISKSGKGEVFIVDDSGKLFATSGEELPFKVTVNGIERIHAINSVNPLIRETAKYLLDDFGNFLAINQDQNLKITIEEEKHFVEINHIKTEGDWELLILVVQPESDFLEEINQNTQRTIRLLILALVAAVILGYFTTRSITQPIQNLSKVSQEIANGKLDQHLNIVWIKELAILAQSFNQMIEQLRESFTALKHTNEQLEQRVEERTKELRISEEKFSTAFRSTYHAITLKRLEDQTYIEVNESFLKLTNYTLEEVIDSTVEDLNLLPNFSERNLLNLLEKKGIVRNYKLDIQTKDGVIKTVLLSAEVIEIDGEKYILTVTNDITETRLAQQELRKERRLLRVLIDSIPDIIFYMDENGTYLACNKAFEQYVGKSRDEIIGKTDLDLFSPDLIETCRFYCAKILTSPETHQYEEVLKYPDGSLYAVDTLISPLLNEEGKLIGIIGVSRDISQRKAGEEELKQAKELAEQATKAKSQFLATMSHEVRTPMNGVLGMTQLLASTELTPEQQKYVRTIDISGNTLLTVINDILDFSKIESGKLDIENRPLDIRACIENVYDVLAVKVEKKNIDLLYLVEPEVPAYIIGDETRINQILMNLVNNGIKFTESGEVYIRVSQEKINGNNINTNNKNIRLHISVSDTGIGMNEEQMSRLFKPFSQGDSSTTRRYGGTGLGLAICSRLIKLMGGKILVESEVGKGSKFSFTIQTKAAPAQPKRYLNKQTPEIKNKRVLLVDDNQTNLEILIWQCQQWEMLPFATDHGKEAISWIERGDLFDLAILDMAMPEMDGLTLGRELRKLKTQDELPLILLTSLGKYNEDVDLINRIFSAHISKPVKQSTLLKTIVDIFATVKHSYQKPPAKQVQIDHQLAEHLPLKILLAEDNIINQEFAVAILEKMGYKIDVVHNGIDAIAACKNQNYDIIFMDVQMPEMDGLEATREIIKQLPSETRPKIIAMTANAMEDDRDECLQAGMDDYVSKPVKIQLMQQMLEKWGTKHTNINDTTSSSQILDRTAMIVSMVETKPELVKKMTHLYLDQEGPRRLTEIKQAIAEENAKSLKHSAHTLKGGSATLGVVGVVEVCRQLEAKAKNQDFADIEQLVQLLEERYEEARKELIKFL